MILFRLLEMYILDNSQLQYFAIAKVKFNSLETDISQFAKKKCFVNPTNFWQFSTCTIEYTVHYHIMKYHLKLNCNLYYVVTSINKALYFY